MSPSIDELVKMTTVAARRDLHPKTLRRAIDRGEIRGFKFGRITFVDPAEVDALFRPMDTARREVL